VRSGANQRGSAPATSPARPSSRKAEHCGPILAPYSTTWLCYPAQKRDEFDSLLVRSFIDRRRSQDDGDIGDIDHAVVDVAKQHEVRYFGLQLLRQERVATRASRLVGDDVRNVAELNSAWVRASIQSGWLQPSYCSGRQPSPEAYLDGLRNAGDRHRYFTAGPLRSARTRRAPPEGLRQSRLPARRVGNDAESSRQPQPPSAVDVRERAVRASQAWIK